MDTLEKLNWSVKSKVRKWTTAEYEAGAEPHDVYEGEGNLLVNVGINRLLDLLIGAGGTAYNSTNSRIGVGTSTTAAAASDTGLIGTDRWALVDSVSRTNQTVTWVATFIDGEAEFAWEEWAIDNGTADGDTATAPLLNRRVQSMGTKGADSVWELSVAITVS
jgi:hypothetical protein